MSAPLIRPEDVAQWTAGKWDRAPARPLHGVCTDTRALIPGSLFVALKGERFDGHDYIPQAVKGGAGGAVVADGWAPANPVPVPLLRVAETTDALAAMAAGYRRQVGLRIIGVTGSAGKSTVKEMIGQILTGTMPAAMTRGNWNNRIGLSLSLLAVDPSARIGVFEVGTNHPGELAPLCRILSPDHGVVTNVGPAHIEHFGTLAAIANEKAELLRSLPVGGAAVLNSDEPMFETLRAACPCRVVTVSFSKDADYRGEWIEGSQRSAVLREAAGGATFRIENTVPGRHNLVNAAMAAATARLQGLDWQAIGAGLASYHPLHMRWEERVVHGVRVVNDAYNANPVSMRAALETFAAEPCQGEKWLTLGGMLELGHAQAAEHESLGGVVARGAWAGVVAVGELGRAILRGAEKAGVARHKLVWCSDNREAALFLGQRLQAGDSVLLKASRGMKFEEIAEQMETNGGR